MVLEANRTLIRRLNNFVALAMFAIAVPLLQLTAGVHADEPPRTSILYGRIIDETGAPVTDATVEITGATTRDRAYVHHKETKTDANGQYQFEQIEKADEFRIRIISDQWVGITDYDKQPRIRLTPTSDVERNFTLQRACGLLVQVLNEAGKPVKGVNLYAASLADERWRASESVSTDENGWATIGGLPPSETEYIIGAVSDEHAFGKLVMKLNLPGVFLPGKIVLSSGDEVRGTAICSDGKPAKGWTIKAMPSWWHFGVSPHGEEIGEDGTFTLRHVVPGEYDVSVSVPTTDGTFRQEQVLTAEQLPPRSGSLDVKLRIPSLQSMASITGRVRFSGAEPKERIWVTARSDDREHYGNVNVDPEKPEFRIHPLPPGRYTVTFDSTEIEQKSVSDIVAPSDDLDVELEVVGRPVIRGTVVDAKTERPIEAFRIRVVKLQYLRGPGYVQDSQWRSFTDPEGKFEVDVVGPAVYQVHVMADGMALTRSEAINTDENQGQTIQLKLSPGVSLSGSVINEDGEPVDGAKVIPLSKAGGAIAGTAVRFASDDGSVQTIEGEFTISELAPGKETLKVTHPDYCFVIVPDADVPADGGHMPAITLTRGGSVHGRVCNARGEPEPDVTLNFSDDYNYSGLDNERSTLFTTAVTDENGDYEAHHLPDQLCYVSRSEPWNSLGVVRQAILPENGRTQTLNFGGNNGVSGRLVVNGVPLRSQRVQLGGEHPLFGVFKAYAQTDVDGSFVFFGPPAGEWSLYYAIPGRRSDWAQVRKIRVTSDSSELGTIEHKSVKVIVHCDIEKTSTNGEPRISLQEYDNLWPYGNAVGAQMPRNNSDAPFVFENVPPGSYELLCYRPDHLLSRERVDVNPDIPVQELRIQAREGTASIRGRMDEAVGRPGGSNPPNLWSKDQRLSGALILRDGNTFEVNHLPAGEYYITDKDTRTAQPVLEFRLADGEQKTLDLTPEAYSPTPTKDGMLVVRVFTDEGVLMSGADVSLNTDGANIAPHGSQSGRVVFVASPGEYLLRAKYPGFKPAERKVTVMPVSANGSPAGDTEVHVRLTR